MPAKRKTQTGRKTKQKRHQKTRAGVGRQRGGSMRYKKGKLGKRENIINSTETTHNLSMRIYICIYFLFLFYITRQVG